MANSFHDLSTDSPGEKRDWQSNRAKDGFPKINPGDHPSPDSSRTSLVPPASEPRYPNTVPSPQLDPSV